MTMRIIVQMVKNFNRTTLLMKNYISHFSVALWFLVLLLLSNCASMRPPIINIYDDNISHYRYFYVIPTSDYISSSGVDGETKSINPSNIISGILIKNGYIQVNEVNPKNSGETMVINFGESGRREINLGYSIEVIIQFISASTQHLICSCTAEGQGETEADDVRIAIQRALEPLFKPDNNI